MLRTEWKLQHIEIPKFKIVLQSMSVYLMSNSGRLTLAEFEEVTVQRLHTESDLLWSEIKAVCVFAYQDDT